MPAILVRPDLGKRAYRLKCRFTLPANPKPSWVEKAKYATAQWFIQDMAKEGWEYVGKFSFTLKGPFPHIDVALSLPKRSKQEQWHFNARQPRLTRVGKGIPGVANVPLLDGGADWDYELSAVFIRPAIVIEMPDKVLSNDREVAHA